MPVGAVVWLIGTLVMLLIVSVGVTIASIRRRAQAEDAGEECRVSGQALQQKLTALQEVTNTLSATDSLVELCRMAVDLGRSRLGFDRMGIWLIDDDGVTLHGMFGTSQEGELINETGQTFRVSDNKLIEDLFSGDGEPLYRRDWPLVDSFGNILGQGEVTIATLRDQERIRGFISTDNLIRRETITDTDRELVNLYASSVGHLVSLRQAQDGLREAMAFDRQLLQSLHAGVVVYGADRRIQMANKKAAEIFGISEEAMLNRTFQDTVRNLIHEDGSKVYPEECAVDVIHKTGAPIENQIVGILRQGDEEKVIWVLSSGFAVGHDGNAVDRIVVTYTDITHIKEVDEERRIFLEKMRYAQKMESLGVLAGEIAHDFNNLLVAILGNADFALVNGSLDSGAKGCLNDIKQAAVRASELASQMLAYSGRGRLPVGPVCLNSVIEEMGMLLEAAIAKNVELRLDLDERLPAIEGDAARLGQVIMNLITNASDAIGSARGTVTIHTCEMEVDANWLRSSCLPNELPPSRYVAVSVVDTGRGMDEETRKKLFDPFFTTKFAGRGLGLAAVLGIVKEHGGTIRVDSQEGKGAAITVLFPKTEKPICMHTPVASDVSTGISLKEDERRADVVLVIDDEHSVRKIATRVLGKRGFKPLVAENGTQGIELFRAHADDVAVVMLDLTMPDMTGQAVLGKLRQIRPDVPVVLCSGHCKEEATAAFTDGQLPDFLPKPFSIHSLVDAIEGAAGRG